MKVSLGKVHGNKLDFAIDGTIAEFANMIRRYGMAEVPVFAIDNIVIYENSTVMFDEYLAHRLGQIPLVTPAKSTGDLEVTLVLDEVGPKMVYSSDLKSSDKDVKSARDKIPIVTLGEGQKLRLEAKAKLANGKTSSKYQSGLVSYGIDGDKFSFKVESFYQMGPNDIVVRACDRIVEDLSELKKGIKKAK